MNVEVVNSNSTIDMSKEVFDTDESSESIEIPISKFKMFESRDNYVLFTVSKE